MMDNVLSDLGPDENSWVTLSWGITHYVTATPCGAGEFVLEIEWESRDFHQRISGGPLPLPEILRIFNAFAQKELEWMNEYEWERVPLPEIDFRKAPDTPQGVIPNGSLPT